MSDTPRPSLSIDYPEEAEDAILQLVKEQTEFGNKKWQGANITQLIAEQLKLPVDFVQGALGHFAYEEVLWINTESKGKRRVTTAVGFHRPIRKTEN